jgi:iron complex transport system substrate-binding protein
MVGRFTRFLWIVAILLPVSALAAEPPQRIVSINLCADELLASLADPGQIAALSVYATDPDLSYVADAAAAFPHNAASAETVVGYNPDLVLAGRFTKRATRDMLARLGYRVELLDAARSIADSEKQIRQVAALVGHPERGEAMVADIEAARERAVAAAPSGKPTAAHYQRRGYVTGGDTLTGELLSIAGFTNDGDALAGKTGGFVPLERLVANPPDYIVVAHADARAEDQGSALLAHPALARLYPPERRIVLPNKLTACGGPSLPAALDWLAAQARHIQPAP